MKNIHLLILCAACLTLSCSTPAERSARDLARRIVPQYAIRFKEVPSREDGYKLYTQGGKLVIEGNNALSMLVGLNRYLNDVCGTTVSWYADVPVEVPDTMPSVADPLTGKALVPQRFFLNYCTFGYTMPWWKWEQWEHFIDWMALHGINLPLSITGQEALWQEVWRSHGLTDEEIRAYFTGPAYLPWHRMNNIDGVDGPLPQGWIDGQKELQKKILKRERALGMRPVLPAFGGHVPGKLKEQYPDAAITDVVRWGGFPQENHCYFLSPQDSLYSVIQQEYLALQTREFGTDHIYGFDLFNEVDPPSWDAETLADIARGAYGSLAQADPEAQWLQMGWLFYNDRRHWTPDIVKAYLEAVPKGKVTILDYYTENIPVWERTEGFTGSRTSSATWATSAETPVSPAPSIRKANALPKGWKPERRASAVPWKASASTNGSTNMSWTAPGKAGPMTAAGSKAWTAATAAPKVSGSKWPTAFISGAPSPKAPSSAAVPAKKATITGPSSTSPLTIMGRWCGSGGSCWRIRQHRPPGRRMP